MPDPRPPASKNLVTTDWLAARLGEPEISIVDGSFYLPALKRDAKAEYLAGHIPGAVFFDIDAIADHSTDLPHMLPGTTQFDKEVGALGIGRTTPSWSMTARASAARRGCGGRSGFSAPRRSTSSMAACRSGRPKAAPIEAGASPAHAAQVRIRTEHAAWSPASTTCRWR